MSQNTQIKLTVLHMIVTGMSAGSCGEEMYLFESEFSPRMSYTSLQLLTLVVRVHALLGLLLRITPQEK